MGHAEGSFHPGFLEFLLTPINGIGEVSLIAWGVIKHCSNYIHDIPWLTVLWLLHHVRSSFSPFKDSHLFSWQEHISEEEKRKRGLISSQCSPSPTSRLGSLTPDNRMAWNKRSRGVKMFERIGVFIQRFPPVLAECVKNDLAVRVCVGAFSSEGLHLEQGGACEGSRVTSWAKQDWSSPSS